MKYIMSNITTNERVQRRIQKLVTESLQEILLEQKKQPMMSKIKNMVKEEVTKYIKNSIAEAEEKKDDKSQSDRLKRQAVMSALKDDKFNHASFAYSLYHPKDQGEKDTARSLFSKKCTGTPDAEGVVRHFTNAEITKLYDLIRKR